MADQGTPIGHVQTILKPDLVIGTRYYYKFGGGQYGEYVSGEFERLKASIAQSAEEIAAASAEFDAVHAKATQTFADLEQNMPAMLAAAAEAAKAAVPVVEEPAIPALHPGEDLIAQLMSMRMPGQKAPASHHYSGNIWENWKPGTGGT